MAETALERFKKDQQQSRRKENRTWSRFVSLDQVQESFLKALEGITEPTPPVRYLKPFKTRFKKKTRV